MSITSSSNKDNIKQYHLNIKNKKTLFFISLITAIIIENSIILYVPLESKIIYTNWILLVNSSVAAGLALLLVINTISKQKILNIQSTIHFTLAIGLGLWLFANVQWIIYEENEIVPDVPSVADLFWLSAYPFLGYSLYLTFKKFYKKYPNSKKIFLTSLICSTIFILSIVYITINLAVFSTSKGMTLFSIIIAYPVLNTILIVPAIVMFIGFKKAHESSIPRMCESLSLINLVLADSWFAIIFLSKLLETIWISNLLIVDHYLIISAGLSWSFLIVHPITFKPILKWKNNLNLSHRIPIREIPLIKPILIVVIPTSILIIFAHSIIFSYSYSNDIYSNYDSNNNSNEIKIGALLGLSGVSSERGKTQKAAIEEAVKDVNKYFSDAKIDKRVNLYIEDTERNPQIAVTKLKNLVDKGVRIVIGPSTSSELNTTKKYIDDNNIDVLLLSHSSTSPSLSKNDNIFRFVQNDDNQGKEIAKKMWNDGIRLVIPIWRDDSYGNELYNAMKINFEKLGGKISEEGIKYDPHVGKFAASLHRINFIMWDQELKLLSYAVNNAKKQILSTPKDSNPKVGVYIIAYGEIIPILLQAPSHKDLDTVWWYGSDGITKNERLLEYDESLKFVNKTKFTAPLMSLDHNNKKYESLENDTKLELNSYGC